MPYAAGNGGSIPQSHCCNLHFRFDRGMSFLLPVLVHHTLTGTVQRNVLRYRRALPNGGWRLLRGPADIYMVRSSFTASRISF
jgi:hypothetical protein